MTKKSAYFYAVGRRKNARATVKIYPQGTGDFQINTVEVSKWADTQEMIKIINKSLVLLGKKKDYDLEVRVSGGGKKAQSEAVSLGIARSILLHEPTLRGQLKQEGLLTRDPRRKERKKPGKHGARRTPQFSKR